MKDLLQGEACDPLQGGGEQDGAQKEQQQVVAQRLQTGQHNDHAKAVNGADRAIEESAVDEFSADQSGKTYFRAPAQKGVGKEDP